MSDENDFHEDAYSIEYGPSKESMFYVLVFYVSAIVLGIVFLAWKLRGYNRPEVSFNTIMARQRALAERMAKREREQSQEEEVPRRRRGIQSRIQQNIDDFGEQDENGEISEEMEEKIEEDQQTKKIGAKKLKKLQEKEERKKMREAMEIDRAERKRRNEEEELARKIEEEREKELEKQKEEEERKAKEMKEKEEHELYLEMKKSFEVDEEGQDAEEDEEESQNKLEEFVRYLKEKKVVLLEDLASRFGLRTQEAIDRVQDLLKEETITGIIDDRGKFIYISNDELEEVAKFVKQRGRVSISEIAAASNRLININLDSEIDLESAI